MANKGFRAELPAGIRIGQRFLLRFDDPRVETGAYQGRLQRLSKSGLLCFDAPLDVRPPKGTPVTVRSIQDNGGQTCAFSSEIRGRGRLRGRLPVLLVEPPESLKRQHERRAQRVSVCIGGQISWREGPRCPEQRAAAVVTNLSGGGAQVFVRQRPDCEYMMLAIEVPSGFVEQTARRATPRGDGTPRRLSSGLSRAGDRVRDRFAGVRARVAGCRLHSRDDRGPVYALSLAFCEVQEGCFQLVRFLERQSLRKGVPAAEPARAGHAAATRGRKLAEAA